MDDYKVSGHMEKLIGNKKNKFTIHVLRDEDDVEEISNVKILYKDSIGIVVEAVKYLGRNRRIFIPMKSIVSMRSELH